MNTIKTLIFLFITVIFSCQEKEKYTTVTVKNTLDIERSFETVELSRNQLKGHDLSHLIIRDAITGEAQLTQTVDNDGDGIMDGILFQPTIAANSEKLFEIVVDSINEKPMAKDFCYSRFVPERIDDYAWENNKVAFRVYGPKAQKLIEDGDPSGTLSSGVDAWLKRVEYPIINNWYKKTQEGTGSYHEDTGEGLDNFHVGSSRGVGGIAAKVDTTYYYSKNYTKWHTLTNGPIRTSFYLEYADWDASGNAIKESRVISLDFGSNLSKFVISLEGTSDIYAGLTLHEKLGKVTGNAENGWLSYWEPIGDSEIGTAILAPNNTFIGFDTYNTNTKDLSNAYAHLKVENNKVVYYSGFGWKKSGQFNTEQDWQDYLDTFSKKVNTPLVVVINE